MALNLQGLAKGKFSLANKLFSPIKLAAKNLPVAGENFIINFDAFGSPEIVVTGDYFKAHEEIADLIGKLSLEDPDKAEAIEGAFYSIKSRSESYLFKVADFLEEESESIHPMQALFDYAWEEVEEKASILLAQQLKNVFLNYKAGDEVKRT